MVLKHLNSSEISGGFCKFSVLQVFQSFNLHYSWYNALLLPGNHSGLAGAHLPMKASVKMLGRQQNTHWNGLKPRGLYCDSQHEVQGQHCRCLAAGQHWQRAHVLFMLYSAVRYVILSWSRLLVWPESVSSRDLGRMACYSYSVGKRMVPTCTLGRVKDSSHWVLTSHFSRLTGQNTKTYPFLNWLPVRLIWLIWSLSSIMICLWGRMGSASPEFQGLHKGGE